MKKNISEVRETDSEKINIAKKNMHNTVLASYIANKAAEEIEKQDRSLVSYFFPNKVDSTAKKDKWKDNLLNQLQEANVDVVTFNSLLNSEINRNLKKKFANNLIWLTIVFTTISLLIIILNSPKILDLTIPEYALTAFIIEIPIQFVGILYIIARHLFPSEKQ